MVLVLIIIGIFITIITNTLNKALINLDPIPCLAAAETVVWCVPIEFVEFLQVFVVLSVFGELSEGDGFIRM